ncbi:thyroid receptor-interacting protein 11-like isoform X1 [Dermacentor albipictus]|uniref:thyroid receptor-interacting protein 11-like isoform X1 n=2 Tax=Dermacentor albipictus TaxID=60249 RepID=UPI0038FD2FDE
MSWLGGTLSSLTSQISNLTSEVLLEGREELDDQGAQLQLFKGRLEQLEGCSATLRKEVERLRSANAELEDRCHATELQLCAERRSRAEEGRRRSCGDYDHVSNGGGNELSLLLEQQRDRIQALERALSEAAVERQEEVATLQSHHARQLAEARLQQQQNMAAEADVPSSQQTSSADPQVPKPNASVSSELLKKRESKDGACQTTTVPDSVVKQLLQEKQQLETSLVELDQQNQATLSQLLALKTKLEAENRHLAKELRKLKEPVNYEKPVSCQASQTDSTSLRTASVETESFTASTALSSRGVQTEFVTETSRESPKQHSAGVRLEARLQDNCQAQEERDRNLEEAREKCISLEQELASCSAREEELEKKLQELTASVKVATTNDVFGERQEGDGAAAQDTSTTAMASMEERLRSLQADKDRILSVMNEKSRESSSLKAEVHRLLGVVAQERQAAAKLRREKEQQVASAGSRESEDAELTRQALRNLSQLVRDRELEVEAEKQKNSTLLQLLRQCSPVDQDQLQELLEERESLAQRAALADEEQGRLKVMLQQKEGELSDVRAEVDRLTLDTGLVRLELDSATQKLEEKTGMLAAVREEALALRQRIAELEMRLQELQNQRDQLAQQHSESQSSQDDEGDKADGDSYRSLSRRSSGGLEPVGTSGALVQHWQMQAEQYQKQVQELQLKEAKLSKELERLRTHLIQMEESYTQEALQAESREESLRTRLMKLEEWARVSDSAAQNATEQASKQVGNLVQQLALAQTQQSALAEELRHSKASLANLQSVLDHFQTEKDREIQLLRSSYESQLSLEREKSRQLVALVTQKQEQLEGSRDALEAAERLSQQLDRREEVIAALKQQLSEREAEVERIRQEVHVVRSTTEGKVDKQIMKSLVLGYFSSPQGQRPEVVRLLARVLDFSRDEMDKAGISLGSQDGRIHIGWISGFFRKSTGAGAGTGAIARPLNRESFSALFVKFLQEESEPQKEVRLPVEAMALGTVSRLPAIKAAPKAAATNTPHLLLQPMSESLPTLAPVTLAPEDSKSSATNSTAFLQEMLS